MNRRKAFFEEMKARRVGRRAMSKDRTQSRSMAQVTRDVTGPTGWVFSNAWDKLDEHGEAYAKSFDRRIPPSLFVSERDRTRFAQPMPLIERCIEDAGKRTPAPPDQADTDILSATGDATADVATPTSETQTKPETEAL